MTPLEPEGSWLATGRFVSILKQLKVATHAKNSVALQFKVGLFMLKLVKKGCKIMANKSVD